MTRPEIIRADSIDLQDHHSPSAQDHTRQPTHPGPLGVGPPAPHQAEALREAAAETAEQIVRSPRVSKEWSNGDVQQLQQYEDEELAAAVTSKLNGANLQKQDNLAIAQNGGLTGSTEDAEMADAEGDDGMDDDMMDKISSSPSIDDGGYSLPHIWPERSDSLSQQVTPDRALSFTQACGEVSSPYVHTPDFFNLPKCPEPIPKGVAQGHSPLQGCYQHQHQHHHLGEYTGDDCDYEAGSTEYTGHWPHASRIDSHEIGDDNYDLKYFPDHYNGTQLESAGGECGAQILEDDEEGIMIPYESSEDEYDDGDDCYAFSHTYDSRFIDFGWGVECLQDPEDIDFEFVYALHTFVATVEGQANATKGDTMVLLDDSNSYWWLVRVVKDSSIGYLPAEHIETPTERLARLNKHRNIDLTSTMLGDQAEKPKNPLKKTIRRRNAKKVTFTAPTYVEASDIDYSTEEEDGEGDYYGQNGQREQDGEHQEAKAEEDEMAAVEPLKPRAELRDVKSDSTDNETARGDLNGKGSSETARASEEISEGRLESKSRNGTVRNTDSFFKDDTVETRKITLTPNLLRDDSSTSTAPSVDTKELKQRASLDKLEKDLVPDKKKDKRDRKDKKDKDKKPGMLSGLFKRKDRKLNVHEDENEDIFSGKRSTENSRSSPVPSKDSEEVLPPEEQIATHNPEVHRQHSKLQKQPRGEMSPSRRPGREAKIAEVQHSSTPDKVAPTESSQQSSMRLVQPEVSTESLQQIVEPSTGRFKGNAPVQTTPPEAKSGGSISKILRSGSSHASDPKPERTKKAKERVELDDFDSSPDTSPVEEPNRSPSKQSQRPIPGSFPDSYMSAQLNERSVATEERLSESPVHISPVIASQSHPPALMVDTSSQEEPSSPISSPSPELVEAEDAREKKGPGSSTSTTTSAWSDAHLRTFFDDDADIKDLLVVVYDKSGVVPAGPDHPIMGNLFREENTKLADITNRLDGMLGDWLARKMRTQASR